MLHHPEFYISSLVIHVVGVHLKVQLKNDTSSLHFIKRHQPITHTPTHSYTPPPIYTHRLYLSPYR